MENVEQLKNAVDNGSVPLEFLPLETVQATNGRLSITRNCNFNIENLRWFLDHLLLVASVGPDFEDEILRDDPYRASLFKAMSHAVEDGSYTFKSWTQKIGQKISLSPKQTTPQELANFLEEVAFDIAYHIPEGQPDKRVLIPVYYVGNAIRNMHFSLRPSK